MTKAWLISIVLIGFAGLAQVQTPSFTLTVTGEKTWAVRFGIGAPELLALENIPPAQLVLGQSLWAEVTGIALGFLTLKASFNDQLGSAFQDFVLLVDRPPWEGQLGHFVVGADGAELGVYNKKLLGARLSYYGDGVTVSGLAARLEGISESLTFRGESARAEVLFATEDPDRPWQPAPYLRHVEGLYFWPLRAPFVEGFSEVQFQFLLSQPLWRFLGDWGLGYLQEVIEEASAVPLTTGDFLVLRDEGDVLLLKAAPAVLLRRQVQDTIEAYNDQHGLSGPDRKTYPFIEGSALEEKFLAELSQFVQVTVDDEGYAFSVAARRRYLLLGERDVIEGTLTLLVRLPGEEAFRPIDDPALADFAWSLYPAEGVLRIAFPDTFFRAGAAVWVAFDYQREGNVFTLGLSVVPGSERVYLNGKPLVRNTDYTIDYEVGMLILFSPLSQTDELRVDFERQRGGLGGYTEYERNFFGLTVAMPGLDGLELSLSRAADSGRPEPTSRTMPNTHSVAALRLSGEVAGWKYRLSLGGSENVFPADDNARIPAPNRINAITRVQAADGEYVVFAHQNGLTVYRGGAFSGYGGAEGMSGRAARDLLALSDRLLIATDVGLTVVRLWEASPFDRVRSWIRLDKINALPGSEVLALAQGGGQVFLATDEAVAVFAPADAEAPKKWKKLDLPVGQPRPTALLWAGGQLYLGTEDGLYVQEGEGWTQVPAVPGPVRALLARGDELHVATDEGIRVLRGGTGAGWIAIGKSVYGMAIWDGAVWYAAEDGLWRDGETTPAVVGPITAVGVGGSGLWAGSRADAEFRLDLWRLAPQPERYPPDQTKIDGRDLGQFSDIPAADHTRLGVTAGLTLARDVGDWRWELSASTRSPGYEVIGQAGRSDSHGVGFVARYLKEESVRLEVRGRWDVVDLFTTPRAQLNGGLDWSWSEGAKAYLSLSPTLTGIGPSEAARLDLSYRAGVSGEWQALSGQLGVSGKLAAPDPYTSGQLTGQLTFRPSGDWSVEGSWIRPFRSRGHPGDETVTVTAKWTGGVAIASWSASWQEVRRHRLLTGDWREERTIQGEIRWTAWSIGDARLAPRLTAFWKDTGEQRWEVRGIAQLSQPTASWQAEVGVGHGYRPAADRTDRVLSLALTWDYSGWDGVRPSFRWQRSWQVLSHPRYPDQVTEDHQATLRVAWEPRGAWRNDLTLTWKARDGSLTLTDQLSWPVEFGTLGMEASATWKEGRLEGKMTAQFGHSLSGMWSLSAEAGYAFGYQPATPFRHALFGGVTLAVRF